MALYNTIYYVAIGGKTLLFEGNEELSLFRWRKDQPNTECLDEFVTLNSRIGIVRAQFEDGRFRKMMVFENYGKGDCQPLAFMLYLCIALDYKYMHVKDLRLNLEKYIHDRPEEYMPRVQACNKDWSRVSECANRKIALHSFHDHAFANMIGVPVRVFRSGPHLAGHPLRNKDFRGEWNELSGRSFSENRDLIEFKTLHVPPSYNMAYVEDDRVCNLWVMKFRTISHAVLMAHITFQRPKLPEEFDDEEDRNEALVHRAKEDLARIRGPLPPRELKMRQIILDAYFAERPLDASGYWFDGRWVPNTGRNGPSPKMFLQLLGDSLPEIRVPWETAGNLRRPLFYTSIVDEMSKHHIDLNIEEVD